MGAFATSTLAIGAANLLGFGISSIFNGCHVHLDLIGTGVFAASAWATRGASLTQQLSAAAVSLWATRLSSFLFYRALITKHDARLGETLSNLSGQIGFWFISFLWGVVVSLPHTLAAGVPVAERPRFGSGHIAGLGIFALGFLIEVTADLSKWFFKANPLNKGAFCDVSVWRLSQHPNWFGNLVLWMGILVLNAPTLLSTTGVPVRLLGCSVPAAVGAAGRFAAAALSPAFLYLLFSGQANGNPPLDKGFLLMMKRHGDDAAFQAYDRLTPRLFPTMASAWRCLRGLAPWRGA